MIALDRVGRNFDGYIAVADVTLEVAEGEMVVLIGPSGCGKSTTLRMINRMIEHTSGQIRIGGTEIASIPPETLRRRMGYVIQSIGLFPHWTVEHNIGAVPALLGWPRARIRARVEELMRLMALDPVRLRNAWPHQLSGGQQQRVGVARALAADPDVLLMDEPFGALDPITRASLQTELARIHRDTGKTIVFVTHDMDEALLLADRIAVMHAGRLAQVGTPLEILEAPASDFVRDFVGADDLGLKLLSVQPLGARLRRGDWAPGEPLPENARLRRALSEMVARGTDRVAVVDAAGQPVGAVHLADLAQR